MSQTKHVNIQSLLYRKRELFLLNAQKENEKEIRRVKEERRKRNLQQYKDIEQYIQQRWGFFCRKFVHIPFLFC